MAAVACAGGGRCKASVAATASELYKAIDQVLALAAAAGGAETVAALKEKFLAVLPLPMYHTHLAQHLCQTSIA